LVPANAVNEFDAGDRSGCVVERPEASHRGAAPRIVSSNSSRPSLSATTSSSSTSRSRPACVDYIRSYRGTPDTLDASLERIRATAQRLSNELDAIRFDAEHDPDPT